MESIFFNYQGKAYESTLKVSLAKEPYYYWCYIKDTNLAGELGEACIVFREKKGVITSSHYFPNKCRPLINILQDAIKTYINGKRVDN